MPRRRGRTEKGPGPFFPSFRSPRRGWKESKKGNGWRPSLTTGSRRVATYQPPPQGADNDSSKFQVASFKFTPMSESRIPNPDSRRLLLPFPVPGLPAAPSRGMPRACSRFPGLPARPEGGFPSLRLGVRSSSQPFPPVNLRSLRMGLRPRRPQPIVHPIISVCTFNHIKEGRL
jgi:hypothetical protein